MQHNGLVFSASETQDIFFGRPEELNVLPKKDLVFVQLPVVARVWLWREISGLTGCETADNAWAMDGVLVRSKKSCLSL